MWKDHGSQFREPFTYIFIGSVSSWLDFLNFSVIFHELVIAGYLWSGIILFSSKQNFHDPDSAVFVVTKTCLRPAHVLKNTKQFIFFSHVLPVGIEPTSMP